MIARRERPHQGAQLSVFDTIEEWRHEAARPSGTSAVDWEREWDRHDELRAALDEVGQTLVAYAGLLGEVCDAKDLLKLTTS